MEKKYDQKLNSFNMLTTVNQNVDFKLKKCFVLILLKKNPFDFKPKDAYLIEFLALIIVCS